MLFFGKKKEEAKKPELLKKENIIINCEPMNKTEAIVKVGKLLVNGGYVKADYVDGMLEREKTFATNMGNGMAIPHGVEAAKAAVLHSGIAVLTFKEGIDWNGENVKLVVGIAGKGDEHLDILANIATKLSETEEVEALVKKDVDTIYEVMTRKED